VTPFSFEHVYRAGSVAEVFEAYWDPTQQIEQDRRLAIVERTVLEHAESETELRRVSRIVPRRQLPALVRPLVSGPLHYIETLRWRRADDEIEIENRPSFLRGRARITALYRLSRAGIGLIRRSYSGAVAVDVPLISSRIERGIVAEYERSLPLAAACTQDWLDRGDRSLSARA
jgi:hypothetical protein